MRQIRRASTPILVLALLLASASQAQQAYSPADVVGPVSWGSAQSVQRLGPLFLADQPDRAGFEAAREAGVRVVIDLRAPGERDWDERAMVEGLGMTYHNVPVAGARFEREAFDRIEALVAERGDAPILVHCSSGNRVAGWLATHLVRKHGMSEADALAVARRAGITKQPVEDGVHQFLAAEGGGPSQ